MMARRQQVVVKLKPAQLLWVERMDECLWPTEKLDRGEISRRLLREQTQQRPSWVRPFPRILEKQK